MLRIASIHLLIALLFPAQLLLAQDEPTHTISEIKVLLPDAKDDSARVKLLSEAALVYVTRPAMLKKDYDSALYYVNSAMNIAKSSKQDVLEARCFTVYSQLYRENNEKAKARKFIDNAIAVFTKHSLKEDQGDALIELQRYYNIEPDSEMVLRIKYAEMAAQKYAEAGNKVKQGCALQHIGDFYMISEKDSLALDRLYKALALFQSVGYTKLEGVYDLIGYVLFQQFDYHQALKYQLLAAETGEKNTGDYRALCPIYNRLGLTYYRLYQYQEALESFTKSFYAALNNKDSLSAIVVSPNIMDSYWRSNKNKELIAFLQKEHFIFRMGEPGIKQNYLSMYILAYVLIGEHTKATPYVQQLFQLVGNDTTNIGAQRRLYRSILPYYLATGEYSKMYKYFASNEAICKKQNIFAGLADNYLWWYKADSALGDLKSAITHYKLHKIANDSLTKFIANQQVNQLRIQHETYKKDQEIATKESNIQSLTNQAKLQQEALAKTRLVRNLTYGLAALLFIIVALLFNSYRLKQRSNKRLQLNQQEIDNKNKSLQKLVSQKEKLLVEKEWLLKEVHHRVKNNMQIVMSLLNSQSAYIENGPALTAIHDSKHRVQAMSLIHQKLYNAENVSVIDMSVYIPELVSYLSDSFDTEQRIRFEMNIEPVELDVSQAVPLGLILNEAITNSIKYAFPDSRNGKISITFSHPHFTHYVLTISDNGVGIPSNITNKKPGSLGMSLIAGLTEDLAGKCSIENNNGTTLKITFEHDPVVKRPGTVVTA